MAGMLYYRHAHDTDCRRDGDKRVGKVFLGEKEPECRALQAPKMNKDK